MKLIQKYAEIWTIQKVSQRPGSYIQYDLSKLIRFISQFSFDYSAHHWEYSSIITHSYTTLNVVHLTFVQKYSSS